MMSGTDRVRRCMDERQSVQAAREDERSFVERQLRPKSRPAFVAAK